jgi:hypothetical protein
VAADAGIWAVTAAVVVTARSAIPASSEILMAIPLFAPLDDRNSRHTIRVRQISDRLRQREIDVIFDGRLAISAAVS